MTHPPMTRRFITHALLLLACLLLFTLPATPAFSLPPEQTADALAALEKLILDPQKDVRRVSVWALGGFLFDGKDAKALPKELKAFSDRFAADPDPTTRLAALVTLARFNDKAAPAQLEKLINEADPKTFDATFAELISPLPPTARRALLDKINKKPASPELRAALIRSLLRAGADADLTVIDDALKTKDLAQRLLVVDELIKLPRPSLERLLPSLLSAKEPELRTKALDLAIALKTPDALNHVASALKDPDPAIATKAEAALTPLQHPALAPLLLDRLKANPKDLPTLTAFLALNPSGASSVLIPLLSDDSVSLDQPLYNAALAAVARDKTPEGAALIAQKLAQIFEKDRLAATYALGFTEDRAHLPTLEKLLSDGSLTIRRTAALSLAQLRDPSAIPLIARTLASNQDIELRVNLIHALALTKDPSISKHLQLYVMGGDPQIRRAAIDALISLNHPDALKPLSLISSDPNPTLRWHIIKGMYLIDPTAHADLLLKTMLDTPEDGFLDSLSDLPPATQLTLHQALIHSERTTLILPLLDQAASSRSPNDLALIRLAYDESPKDKAKLAAIQHLATPTPAAPDLPRFKQLFDHKDRAQRILALQTLLRFDPGSADDIFTKASSDADPLIQALGLYGLSPR